jgi:lysophospholipase L1-like esterase
MGDSITEGLIGGVLDTENRYTTVLENSLHAAGCSCRVVNAGRGGMTSAQGAMSFLQNLSASDPNVVTILYGANDLLLSDEGVPGVLSPSFGEALRFMVRESRASGALPVLLTLVPIIAEKFYVNHDRELYESRGGIETLWQEYDSTVRKVAREEGVAIFDIEELFGDSLDLSLGPDGTHPSVRGHELMGQALARLLLDLEPAEGQNGGGMGGLEDCYAYPSPYRPGGGALMMVHVRVGSPGRVDILVFDPSGRKVASLPGAEFDETGDHWFVWDGRDSNGSPVAPGVYLFTLRWTSRNSGACRMETLKVAVLR